MPPTLQPLPDDALDGKFRLTLAFALAELLPLVAVFGWLGIMEGYIETPMDPRILAALGPSIALLCLASLGVAPLSLMITAATLGNFKKQLARFGEEGAVRRALLDGIRRELRDRGGPNLRAMLGVEPEVWAAADGVLALSLAPAPLAQMNVGEAADGFHLIVSTREGWPKVNVVWRLCQDSDGRWRVASHVGVAEYLRSRLQLNSAADSRPRSDGR